MLDCISPQNVSILLVVEVAFGVNPNPIIYSIYVKVSILLVVEVAFGVLLAHHPPLSF